jgi:membrane-associated phospholipid phosphatase
MKFYLPQAPIPSKGVESTGDYAPLTTFITPYSYPSGHALRGVIVLGALCVLSRNRLPRVGALIVLAGIVVSRVYLGTHWASDAVGGALLGFEALLWAFGKEKPGWRSR